MPSLLPLLLLAYACLVSPINSVGIQWKNIFILAGQSNMSGRGGVINETWDGIVPLESRPKTMILRLNAQLNWEQAMEPIHRDIDWNKTCGVGPAMAFANGVLVSDSSFGMVGLVPCAIGGTNISEWGKGSRLYNEMVRRAAAAVLDGGVIRAVLWYQGESDTVFREDAERYKGNLEKFILDLRDDLQSPVLPVFQVALASGSGPYTETVREAQLGIRLPNVMTVDAKGLLLEPDGLHLTTPAQVRLGQMLANAFLQTSQPMPIRSNAPRPLSNFISYSSVIGRLFANLKNRCKFLFFISKGR